MPWLFESDFAQSETLKRLEIFLDIFFIKIEGKKGTLSVFYGS